MDAIPYLDQLIEEYLLFRGYVKTYTCFNQDRANDATSRPQVEAIARQVLVHIKNLDLGSLEALWSTLRTRFFVHLTAEFAGVIQRLEHSLQIAYLVHCHQSGAYERMIEFFRRQPPAHDAAGADSGDGDGDKILSSLLGGGGGGGLQQSGSAVDVLGLGSSGGDVASDTSGASGMASALGDSAKRKRSDVDLGDVGSGYSSGVLNSLVVGALDRPMAGASSPAHPASSLPPSGAGVSGARGDFMAGARRSSDDLLSQAHMWFALPYTPDPQSHPFFAPYFTRSWQERFTTTLRNFLSTVFEEVALPKLLAFNVERLQRRAMSSEIRSLRAEVQRLKFELEESEATAAYLMMQSANGTLAPPATPPPSTLAAEGDAATAPGGVQASPSANEEGEGDSSAAASVANGVADAGDGADAEDARFDTSVQTVLEGHSAQLTQCRFSNEGNQVASGSKDGTVRIWEAGDASVYSFFDEATHKPSTTIFNTAEILALTWDETDSLLLFGTADAKVRLWNVNAKKTMCEMVMSSECPRVLEIASSPTDALFVVSSASKMHDSLEGGKGTLSSWSMQTGRQLESFQFEASMRTQVNTVVFNHNGNMLMTGGADGMIRVFDMATCQPIMGWPAHDGQVSCVRFSADENMAASIGLDGTVVEWSLHRIGKRIRTYELVDPSAYTRFPVVRAEMAFDMEGQHFLTSCGAGHRVGFLYDTEHSRPVQLIRGHEDAVLSVDWHMSEPICLTGSADRTMRITHMRPKT